jgi:hypothetical protein
MPDTPQAISMGAASASTPQTSIQPLIRMTTPGMRAMLLVASVLVFIVGIQLFIMTDFTDRFFAWTVKPSLTAAFLGAAYWSSFILELLASRERIWARARIAVPAVLVFTTLTLIISLIHLDRFHMNVPDVITRSAAYAWLGVYAVVPLVMTILLVRQLKMPDGDPPRERPIPRWLIVILVVLALIMLFLGVGLLVAPQQFAVLWPWMLTPLTGRAVGAWLLGLGIGVAQVIREGDYIRARPVAISAVVFALLEFTALARYPGDMSWGDARGWFYLAFLVSMLLFGAYGWRAASGQQH